MYLCVRGIDFVSFYDFSIRFLKYFFNKMFLYHVYRQYEAETVQYMNFMPFSSTTRLRITAILIGHGDIKSITSALT